MQILFLTPVATFFFDVIAWAAIHLSIGYWCSKLPVERFNPNKRIYRTHAWEKDGEIYQRIFKVRAWKDYIPSGASVYASGYSIKNLRSYSIADLERWLCESCRAEFCHWMMIFPGFFFFLWNSIEVGWGMVAYAVLNNLVPIIMQRFNRPRIRKILNQLYDRAFHQTLLPEHREQEKVYLNSYC
jgi:glycosyl-4,4'-diaponeurosporenoate acyltransferase